MNTKTKKTKNVAKEQPVASLFKIVEVNKSAKHLDESLGITDERAKELTNMCRDAHRSSSNLVQAMSTVSDNCVNANELFYASNAISEIHSMHNRMVGFMSDLFEGILNKS